MLIQGNLFTDYYIPDSVIAEIRQHLLLQPAVIAVGVDPEYDSSGDEFIITVVIADCDDDTYNVVAGYLFHYAKEINQKLETSIYFHPAWLQYPDDFYTSFLRSFIMELKFFKTRTAPNRNYVEIISGNFSIKEGELDYSETKLLKKWFQSYSRAANKPLLVQLQTSSSNGSLYLRSDEVTGEVFTNPELLKERLTQLHQIEVDFFKQIEYIKQPKF